MSRRPVPLARGYTAEIDRIDRVGWHGTIRDFSDASIYQTWSYEATRHSEKNLSHLILKRDGEVVAGSQARIVRLPVVGPAVAYARWAPFWKRRGHQAEAEIFRMAVRALRNEYTCRRRMVLRILPFLLEENSESFLRLLQTEGYSAIVKDRRPQTLVLDLRRPLEDLRKGFDQKWRNCLNRAERNGLEIVEGTDDRFFEEFIRLYQKLLERKRFPEPNNIHEFRRIQDDLPGEMKMRVFLSRSEGVASAGAVFAAIGETGTYLFGAIDEEGMSNKGSYLIQWKAIDWLKKSGCLRYDLNGINPLKNPGTYHFKAGIAGKESRALNHIGSFDSYPTAFHSLFSALFDQIKPVIKKLHV